MEIRSGFYIFFILFGNDIDMKLKGTNRSDGVSRKCIQRFGGKYIDNNHLEE
jgi:hypothetical protein